MTLGEYRVGITFNPSSDSKVDLIKRKAADLIDLVIGIEVPTDDERQFNEVARLKAMAMSEIENGAMWAVKACTKPASKPSKL